MGGDLERIWSTLGSCLCQAEVQTRFSVQFTWGEGVGKGVAVVGENPGKARIKVVIAYPLLNNNDSAKL